jgi:hypothetical protein
VTIPAATIFGGARPGAHVFLPVVGYEFSRSTVRGRRTNEAEEIHRSAMGKEAVPPDAAIF